MTVRTEKVVALITVWFSVADRPAGAETDREIGPAAPLTSTAEMLVVALKPWGTLTVAGLAESEKSPPAKTSCATVTPHEKQRSAYAADLAKDIVNRLTDDSEWRLDVLDESGKPVFRLRLLAESLDKTAQLPFAVGPRPIS